jgi:hypothetical protein
MVVTWGGAEGGSNGWNVADGDMTTAWVGDPEAGGWWLSLAYEAPVEAGDVLLHVDAGVVLQPLFLVSEDAENWTDFSDVPEGGSVRVQYLWVIIPDDGSGVVPVIREVTLVLADRS